MKLFVSNKHYVMMNSKQPQIEYTSVRVWTTGVSNPIRYSYFSSWASIFHDL